MKYNDLTLETKKTGKRLGRGIASGKGKTATRGTKGQKSRAGSSRRPGFSGGQNPLMQQLPKLPGFKSKRPKNEIIFTDQLEGLKKSIVDNFVLFEARLTSSPHSKVKLLSRGDLKSKITLKIQSISAEALNALEKSGGSFEKTEVVKRQPKKPATKQ